MKKTFVAATALLLSMMANVNAAVIAVEQSAFAGATVINFDNLSNSTPVTTQYAGLGVANFNATVLGAQGQARIYSSVPAHSGANTVFLGGSIQFTSAVDRVGAWIYKSNGTQYLTALDANMNVLMSVAQNTSSMDSANYDFVGIASNSFNIAYVVISNKNLSLNPNWDIGGATTFFDDFTFGGQQAVPEPATPALLGLGILGLLALRRKKVAAA